MKKLFLLAVLSAVVCGAAAHPNHIFGVRVGMNIANMTFKTGGVDGCDCDEILSLIKRGRLDTTPLITHTFDIKDIARAYDLFESRSDGVIKTAPRSATVR